VPESLGDPLGVIAEVAPRTRLCDAFSMKGTKGGTDPLHRVSMFGGLRNDTLDFLLARAELVSVAKGDVFFREGEPGGALYILRRGRAEVIKSQPAGRSKKPKKIQVAEIRAGGCFGEVSLLAVMPRSATVAALEDCEALRLRYGDLHELYQRDVAEFALLLLNLGREVARRLWRADQMLVDFADPNG
jgi:CRP/FNR family transcriptional regulator, cyclic AMP receptor protein